MLHFQMTFSLSSTSSLVKLPFNSVFATDPASPFLLQLNFHLFAKLICDLRHSFNAVHVMYISYPKKIFPMPRKGMKNALRHIPRMPSFPATCCSKKSYSNTPNRNSSLLGALIPSRYTSPFTGILISARNPSLICLFVEFQSACHKSETIRWNKPQSIHMAVQVLVKYF